MRGFSLEGTLGTPEEAANKLLSEAIAPPGSGRETTLLSAFESDRGPRQRGDGALCYQFEYVLKRRDGRELHNIAVIGNRGDELYTLTVLVPEEEWAAKRGSIEAVASSFHLR